MQWTDTQLTKKQTDDIVNVNCSKLDYVPFTLFFRYIAVQYNTDLHTAPQRRRQNFVEKLYSSYPSKASVCLAGVCAFWIT